MIVAPARRADSAIAGAASCGSALPSVGVNKAPGQRRVEPGRSSVDFVGAEKAGGDLKLARAGEPGFVLVDVALAFAEIDDAGLAKAGFGADLLVHALPQAQALDGERYFRFVSAHRPAPAPIPARLLAGDSSLFAKRDRDAFLGEIEGGADADDAAANDDDVGAGGKGRR